MYFSYILLNNSPDVLLAKYHDYSQLVKGLAMLSSDNSLKSVIGTEGIFFTSITKIVCFFV